jgi:hypothetical protein
MSTKTRDLKREQTGHKSKMQMYCVVDIYFFLLSPAATLLCSFGIRGGALSMIRMQSVSAFSWILMF